MTNEAKQPNDYNPRDPFVLMTEQLKDLRVVMRDVFSASRNQTLATQALTDAVVELTTEIRAMRGEREAREEASGNGHHTHVVLSLDDNPSRGE